MGAVTRRRFSVEDYHRMAVSGILTEDDRVELLDGEIVEMSPIGDDHADCVDRLNAFFVRAVWGQARVRIQNPVRLADHSEPEPDLVLARPGRGHPRPRDVLLLVEVADTSLERDREVKLPLYAAAGIPEVWIVDVAGAVVDLHRDPGPEGYRSCTRHVRGEAIAPLAFPAVSVGVDEILG